MALKTIEFYCGTKSFSKVADSMDMETFTVDLVKSFKPDLRKNMWDVVPSDVPYKPDILWASPDCSCWSCAAGNHHFDKWCNPQTLFAEQAIKQMERLLWLIEEIGPEVWYIENPRGKLRKMPFMEPFIRNTVTYCQYGFDYMKPTDIWTNNPNWNPKPICDVMDNCHPGSVTNKSTSRQRATIPPALIREILLASR